jgi:nucleotide-binding universal stress UspA family protein
VAGSWRYNMRHDPQVLRVPATEERQLCFQRILVGVDFRQPSLAAARWAAAQFGAGAAIELAHVLQVPDVPGFLRPLMPAPDDRLETATARPLQGLRGFAETLGAKHLSALTRIGLPVDRLVERARAFEADLVVLGRMTVSGTRGRTVERLIRRLSVPALVVAGGAKERPRRILAAVDDAGIGPTVVHWAAVLAGYFDAELTLLHVLDKTLLAHEWLSEAGRDENWHGPLNERSRSELLTHAWLRGLYQLTVGQSLAGHTVVAAGAPGPAILDQARTTRADLIVVGRNGAHVASPTDIGAAARLVLRAARVPVFVVPRIEVRPQCRERGAAVADQNLSRPAGNPTSAEPPPGQVPAPPSGRR